jgi:uncharacterized protein YbbC (DUF1343 family)/Asp-tRNA(Asn)/Glu-tRNA(Gln) amidotransferase A subunit family amidase
VRRGRGIGALIVAAIIAAPGEPGAQSPPPPDVVELTIAGLHDALRDGRTSCRDVVEAYLARIDSFDKHGPALNAIVVVNPRARSIADSLDGVWRRTHAFIGSLHCVPMIVKDNFQTAGLQTTGGSLAFAGWEPRIDATMVRQVEAAGAIVLAKSNMAELAFSPVETVSSILPGYTRNPYALDRVTAGSSGGTAASIAASFGLVGLGTDTGNSIRGPSSHAALVGIRSTMGLTSRAGIVPLNLAADVAGPMARTVADAVAVFQVITGADPADPATAVANGRAVPDYAAALRTDGLRGARVGVLPQAYLSSTTDAEVRAVFARAVDDLRRLGATVVDSVMIPELDSLRRAFRGSCNPFKHDFEQYLASQGEGGPPVHSLDALIRSRRFHPSIERRLQSAAESDDDPERTSGCVVRDSFRVALRAAVTSAMDAQQLDALIHPTWSNPPRLIGDLNTPAGDNSQLFSPSTGFPAITVPMGYTRGTLPAGLQMLGRPFDESTLIRLAYAYEQGTQHRHPPASTTMRVSSQALACAVDGTGVMPGVEVLLRDSLHLVRGKRVGLITNHSGRDRAGTSTIDLLHGAPGVTLAALFSPEHGIRGAADAGEQVASSVDSATGVPIHSLYGEHRVPTPEMLRDIDVLVYDIQDVGARVYTYEWTMALSAAAAAAANVPFIVLDRPDPVRADRVDGGVLHREFASFVGQFPVALRYGLTPGELARYLVFTGEIQARLTVVPMCGYRRAMWWDETGLAWVNPSPNLRTLDATLLYTGTVFFEGTNLSEGRGTDAPFQLVGAKWMTDAAAIAASLNAMALPGVRFDTTTRAVAAGQKWGGETIPMIRVTVTDRDAVTPVNVGAWMVRAIYARHRGDWEWRTSHFDRLAGTDALRLAIIEGDDALRALLGKWEEEAVGFAAARQEALLYR